MQIYLPIAEMAVNALVVLAMGGVVGFLSGMFGVGGGFLMTPLLIFLGVPPAVAVGTQANQQVASSVSGAIGYWRRQNVDLRMGVVMLTGGLVGTALGVALFGVLKRMGMIDLVISLLYVVLLGGVGVSMLIESVLTMVRLRRKVPIRPPTPREWLQHLPFKIEFPRSKLNVSVLVPSGIGLIGGILVALMGIGGGFLTVPLMIYVLGMPTALVAGTSLFQIIFTTAIATLLQAVMNRSVDFVLAALLVLSGAFGAQIGGRFGVGVRGEVSRVSLALMALVVAAKLGFDLLVPPEDLFWIESALP